MLTPLDLLATPTRPVSLGQACQKCVPDKFLMPIFGGRSRSPLDKLLGRAIQVVASNSDVATHGTTTPRPRLDPGLACHVQFHAIGYPMLPLLLIALI
jgi:hypothetical protein